MDVQTIKIHCLLNRSHKRRNRTNGLGLGNLPDDLDAIAVSAHKVIL
jgi:hypothetical protein